MSVSDRLRRNAPAVVDGCNVMLPEVCTPEEIMERVGVDSDARDLVRIDPNGLAEVIPKGSKIRIVGNIRLDLQIINEGGKKWDW